MCRNFTETNCCHGESFNRNGIACREVGTAN
jgi:hypothetical protein